MNTIRKKLSLTLTKDKKAKPNCFPPCCGCFIGPSKLNEVNWDILFGQLLGKVMQCRKKVKNWMSFSPFQITVHRQIVFIPHSLTQPYNFTWNHAVISTVFFLLLFFFSVPMHCFKIILSFPLSLNVPPSLSWNWPLNILPDLRISSDPSKVYLFPCVPWIHTKSKLYCIQD